MGGPRWSPCGWVPVRAVELVTVLNALFAPGPSSRLMGGECSRRGALLSLLLPAGQVRGQGCGAGQPRSSAQTRLGRGFRLGGCCLAGSDFCAPWSAPGCLFAVASEPPPGSVSGSLCPRGEGAAPSRTRRLAQVQPVNSGGGVRGVLGSFHGCGIAGSVWACRAHG